MKQAVGVEEPSEEIREAEEGSEEYKEIIQTKDKWKMKL